MKYRAYLYDGDRLIAAAWHDGEKISKTEGHNVSMPIAFEIPVECEPTHLVVFDDIILYPDVRKHLMPGDTYRIDRFHQPKPELRVVEIIYKDGRRVYPTRSVDEGDGRLDEVPI
jgi:hypothetical protein